MGQAVAIPIAAAVAAAVAGAGASALLAPKPNTAVQKPMTPNDAAARSIASREFRLRQGAGANELTGPNGAEAPSFGTKNLLGQ